MGGDKLIIMIKQKRKVGSKLGMQVKSSGPKMITAHIYYLKIDECSYYVGRMGEFEGYNMKRKKACDVN